MLRHYIYRTTLVFILHLSFLISLFAQVSADKEINFYAKNESLSSALLRLSELADVNISFSPSFFPKDKKINFTAEKQSVKLILRKCLEGTEISFKMSDGGIILFRELPKYYTLSGYLTDHQTGERLVGANIIDLNSMRGAAGNAYGFYSQKLKAGKLRLQVSYLGYQTAIIEQNLDKNTKLDIALEPTLTLEQITVVSTKDSVGVSSTGGATIMPLEWLGHLPHAIGESDVMRYVHLMPGVQTGADGFGGLHVRGGGSDQNLILLDDVPVYNPSHTFGLFSIFNPDLAKSVKFYKGGFPARYGGRLSSVLDVRTREGNDQEFSAELSAGTMATRGIFETPIKKGRGGLLIAGRSTHINLWLPRLSAELKPNDSTGEMLYDFFDLNIKAHYSLSLKDKIYFSHYRGQDNFSDDTNSPNAGFLEIEPGEIIYFSSEDSYSTAWGNQIVSIRWNHLFNDRLFANTTATFSDFTYTSQADSRTQSRVQEEDFEAVQFSSFYSSQITDFSLRSDFDFFADEKNRLRFGANTVFRGFVPGFIETETRATSLDSLPDQTEITIDDPDILQSTELNIYAEDELKVGRFNINAGVHLSAFLSDERSDFIPQPRINIDYTLHNQLKLNISAARTAQYVHLVTNSDAGLPEDLWVPSGAKTPPQKAWQYTAGISGSLGTGNRWSLEAYYKDMRNLLRIQPEILDAEPPSVEEMDNITGRNREDILEKGRGTAFGTELMLEKQKGKLTGFVSYSLADTERFFRGKKIPIAFNIRHSINISAAYRLTDWLNLSGNWIYKSGRPRAQTDITEYDIPFINLLDEVAISPTAARLPAYHRLDVGMNLHFDKKRLKHKVQLGVYNAYNRANVFVVYANNEFGSIDEPQGGGVRSLPFLPSLGYSVRW